jgi:diaminohydroxyphosphoribosylaminopyrimidine deaminase/5-amino-6-(5-phosphoribosylamino)uracil reductase
MQKITDKNLMALALIEASRSQVTLVRPNPRVGAALVSSSGIIVSGFHKKAGGPHAEIEVFNECKLKGIDTQGATLAVTLEPCSHFGKTPPCAQAVIDAGISKVLYAGLDPNPLVSGRGVKLLQDHGVEVVGGLGSLDAFELNREWLTAHKRKLPFIRIKMATSLDGLMSAQNGDSQWITGVEARNKGHELRAKSELMITGTGTVKKDNPKMSARGKDGKDLERQPQV